MTRFTVSIVPEVTQPFWEAMQRGELTTDAAALVGTDRHRGLTRDLTAWRAASKSSKTRSST